MQESPDTDQYRNRFIPPLPLQKLRKRHLCGNTFNFGPRYIEICIKSPVM